MAITELDKKWLDAKKKQLFDNCACKGTDMNCACIKNFRIELKKVQANIPYKYREYTLDNITYPLVQESKTKVSEFIANIDANRTAGLGLYLYGSSGLAKTSLGCITLMEALKKGYSIYFTTLEDCVSKLVQGWFGNDEDKFEYQEKIINSDFLMIDNVGSEYRKNTDLLESSFDSFFRKRSDAMLPVIFTSNYTQEVIGNCYGIQLVSLFKEHLMKIEFKGDDYRKTVISPARQKKKEKK